MAGPKKFFKKRTKRTTTRERVKQVKKLSEHAAKLRKEKKKNPEKFQKKSAKKQWKIPADCKFKAFIMPGLQQNGDFTLYRKSFC